MKPRSLPAVLLMAVALAPAGASASSADPGPASCSHAPGGGAMTSDQALGQSLGALPLSTDQQVVVTGEIVDGACLASHGGFGPPHADCAARGLAAGDPVFIRLEGGKAILLVANREHRGVLAALRHMAGRRLDLRGARSDGGGLSVLIVTAFQRAL